MRSHQPRVSRTTVITRREKAVITQIRMPALASCSMAAAAPGAGVAPMRPMASQKERSSARCAACPRAWLSGNMVRRTSTVDRPRSWCTWAMHLAYAAVPVTTPCVAMASAYARSTMPPSVTTVPIRPQHTSETGIAPLA